MHSFRTGASRCIFVHTDNVCERRPRGSFQPKRCTSMSTKDDGNIKSPRVRGKPFQPGNRYGKGRPPGSRNQATLALQELLDGEGESILRKKIELALRGNEKAQKLCLERMMPPSRERAVRLSRPIK